MKKIKISNKLMITLLLLFTLVFSSCEFLLFDFQSSKPASLPSITVLDTYEKQSCDWLFIMYVDGDNDLVNQLYQDLNEFEAGLYQYSKKTEKPSVKVVALWDGYPNENSISTKTKILELGADSENNPHLCENTKDLTATAYSPSNNWINYNTVTKTAEVDMSSEATLANFLNWVDQYYEAQHKILQFSNHGGGPRSVLGESGRRALCWDFTTDANKETSLTTKGLGEALNKAGYGAENQFEMLLFDICLGASIEDSYEFRNYAKYLLASPNSIPGFGLNYAKMLNNISDSATGKEIGKGIINDFKDFYTNHPKYFFIDWDEESKNYGSLEEAKYLSLITNTLSLIDLSKVEKVATRIDELAGLLRNSTLEKIKLTYETTDNQKNTISLSNYFKNNITFQRTLTSKEEHNLTYLGTFTWLYDLGFITRNIGIICDSVDLRDESADVVTIITKLKTAVSNLNEALKAAIVYSWREGPEDAEEGFYTSNIPNHNNSLYFGENLPYGLTISGASNTSQISSIGPSNYSQGGAPYFYKTDLTFGQNTSWGDLLIKYFDGYTFN